MGLRIRSQSDWGVASEGGHNASPMTNLKLEHSDLALNYALLDAVQCKSFYISASSSTNSICLYTNIRDGAMVDGTMFVIRVFNTVSA